MLLSIDPGLRGCGVAAWGDDKQLLRAAYVKNPDEAAWLPMVEAVKREFKNLLNYITYVAIEIPQVYVQARWKGDPNDLIQLAGLVGCFCGALDGTGHKLYKPAEWKGQVKKEITEMRARKRLSATELAVVELPKAAHGLAHNVWDSVALGLFHLGRR